MELREVDPRTLKFNPNNPRRTKASEHADAQLLASVRAFGVLQPALVKPVETGRKGKVALEVIAGERRVRAAVAADKPLMFVLVQDAADPIADPMKAVSENLVRADMGPVDRWRAMESLAGAGWTDAAIAGALSLTPRSIAQLRLLAHICPAMLDRMAQGDMPREHELRVIAAASADEQAGAWKAHKPKRAEEADWHAIAGALRKRRMPATAAKFGPDEAAAFGIVWEEDLFAPADEDSRATTQVDAFLEAQQAWLEANLPPGGSIVPVSDYGGPQLPKGATERYTSAPSEGDLIAFGIDPRTGEIRHKVYEMRERATAGVTGDGDGQAIPQARPDMTQKGMAMIGDYRTEALHRALRERPIDDHALIGMLVLALAGNNVDVRSGVAHQTMAGYGSRGRIAEALTGGGVLTSDPDALRHAAREMLVEVLSCRVAHSNSGMGARHAGVAIDADGFLPNMATDEFLPCLSKAALGLEAAVSNVAVQPRAKDTRAALIERFREGTWIYPGARFAPDDAELEARRNPSSLVRRTSTVADPEDERTNGWDGDRGEMDGGNPEGDNIEFQDARPFASRTERQEAA